VKRRRLLALLAGAAGLAGCAGGTPGTPTDGPATTGTPTTTDPGPTALDAGEAYDAGEWSLTVQNPAARRGVVEFGTTHPDPLLPPDRQFVVVDVAVEGDGPDPAGACLAARLDERRPFETCRRHYVAADRNGTAGDRSVQVTALPVPLDVGDAGEASVVWRRDAGDEAVWRLPGSVLADLSAPPAFEVRSFTVPETARPETEFEATVAVANAGARDGVFVGELGTAALSDQPDFELPVPAGETVETTRAVEPFFSDGADAVEVRLGWDRGEAVRTVRRA
jgi:hypothetical protein